MNKEILEIINELSKKPTGELALCLAESVAENIDLQNRIDKAIEYIEKQIPCIHDDEILDNLQNILKGDDK
ncbi:MAG: hypothetical protein IKR57_01780 [Bacilli bacterium]|nr:hypothetical protein [Bacilli bacterium]